MPNRMRLPATAATAAAASAPSRKGNGIDDLAARALSDVAARYPRWKRGISEAHVDRLMGAVMGRSEESYRPVARRMLSGGIAPETIADEYIPAVARRMGEEWTQDTASFADVTIGSARLQSMLRDLSTCWTADRMDTTGSAMVIVPQNVHHTLGASVLTTQLRRTGISVRLCVGMDPRALKVALDHGEFDAVIISASINERIDMVRTIVDLAHSATGSKRPPVILGGTILDQRVNVQRVTGADLATVDLREAMEFCGLPQPDVLH